MNELLNYLSGMYGGVISSKIKSTTTYPESAICGDVNRRTIGRFSYTLYEHFYVACIVKVSIGANQISTSLVAYKLLT